MEDRAFAVKKPDMGWYVLPILFGILGGVAGYLLVQDQSRRFAKNLVLTGIIFTAMWTAIIFSFFAFSAFVAFHSQWSRMNAAWYPANSYNIPTASCNPCFTSGDFNYAGSYYGKLILTTDSRVVRISGVNIGYIDYSSDCWLNMRCAPGSLIVIGGIPPGTQRVIIYYTLPFSDVPQKDTAFIRTCFN